MTTKILAENILENQIFQTLDEYSIEIQEKALNLSSEDYSTQVYLVMGHRSVHVE